LGDDEAAISLRAVAGVLEESQAVTTAVPCIAAGGDGVAGDSLTAEGGPCRTGRRQIETDVIDAIESLAADVKVALTGRFTEVGEWKSGKAVSTVVVGETAEGNVDTRRGLRAEALTPAANQRVVADLVDAVPITTVVRRLVAGTC
jgi:hypothetical protein